VGLFAIALPCLVYAMDVTVLHLAVPTLTRQLRPSAAQILWIVDIYGFLLAGALVTMGNLGDRIGRRCLLMMGAAAFAAASTLAAFSRTPGMLIAARAVLGVAGATLAPSTLSLIRNMFHDEHQRTAAIGIWGTSFALGGAIGPVVGGLLLHRFWWGSVFLVPVPVMGLLLLVGPRLLPEFRDPAAGKLDLPSAALSLGAILAVIYGLKRLAQDGLPAIGLALGSVAAGVALGTIFVRRQRHLAQPLVDLRLFRAPAFSVTIATLMLNVFALFGVMFFTAQYYQLVLGLPPLRAGLWMLPSSICIVASSLSSARLVRSTSRTTVLAGGMLFCTAGCGVLAFVGCFAASGGFPVVLAASILWGLGAGPVGTLATDLVVGFAPPERAGSVASLSETSAELGGALGLAVLGSIGVAVYRLSMADVVVTGAGADAARAARGTLSAALSVAAGLPGPSGGALIEAARAAFVHAFVAVALVSAALMALSTVVLRIVVARSEKRDGAREGA